MGAPVRELTVGLRRLLADGTPFVPATTVAVRDSSPRGAGATIAVDAGGGVLGSLSGGCVEAAVYDAAGSVLAGGPARLATRGIAEDELVPGPDGWSGADPSAVGLSCGDVLDVLVDPVHSGGRALVAELLEDLDRAVPVALATVVGGAAPLGARLLVAADHPTGSLGDPGLEPTTSAPHVGAATGVTAGQRAGRRRRERTSVPKWSPTRGRPRPSARRRRSGRSRCGHRRRAGLGRQAAPPGALPPGTRRVRGGHGSPVTPAAAAASRDRTSSTVCASSDCASCDMVDSCR